MRAILLTVTTMLTLGVTLKVDAGAASITFSKYRILLDKETKSEQLTLRNTGTKTAECELGLSHFNFDEKNILLKQASAETTYMPANKLLRYSPRSVNIPVNGVQKVKISYRRRANMTLGEYISFFKISCIEESPGLTVGQPNISAKINYNLPVHVKIGDLQAKTSFEVTAISSSGEGYILNLRQFRQGNRSLVGDLKIIDKSSGDELGKVSNLGVYRPAKYVDHIFRFKTQPKSGVLVEFIENKKIINPLAQTFEISASKF